MPGKHVMVNGEWVWKPRILSEHAKAMKTAYSGQHKAAKAAAMPPTASYLRDVVARDGTMSVLSCGHRIQRKHALAGMQRYCGQCRADDGST